MQNKYIIISALFLVYAFIYYSQKPLYDGVQTHSYKKYGDVTIYREKDNGIPHIHGKNINSVCFGQGYAHGQDRLFQMNVKKMFASGRLSEFLGPKTLTADKMMRELNFVQISEQTVQKLKPQTKECLQAYSDGVNQAASQRSLPIEFKISGIKLEDWTVIDSLVQQKLLGWSLVKDHVFEVFRTRLAEIVGEEKAREYCGMGRENQFENTEILSDEDLKRSGIYQQYKQFQEHKEVQNILKGISLDLYEYLKQGGGVPGSNSWVISGNLTTTGYPILANDPHLATGMPCIWYQNEILYEFKGYKKSLIGVTTPGLPGVIIGKGDKFSVGATVLFVDSSDLYYEDVNYEKETYKVDGKDRKLIAHTHEIKVKGQKSMIFKSYETHRGPVTQYLFSKDQEDNIEKTVPLSFAWGGNKRVSGTDTLIQLLTIDSHQDFIKVGRSLDEPWVAIVYAFEKQIGFMGLGSKPVRKDPLAGGFVQNGSISDLDWEEEFQDSQFWPQAVNPSKNYFVAANNRFSSNNIKDGMCVNQFSTPRASRIDEMIREQIQQGKKFSVQDNIKFQADVQDYFVKKTLPGLINLWNKHKFQIIECQQQRKKIDYYLNRLYFWNYDLTPESEEAAIFNIWSYLFLDKTMLFFKDQVYRKLLVQSYHFDQFFFKKLDEFGKKDSHIIEEEWCENEESKNCIFNLFNALLKVEDYLNSKVGKNDWRKGLLHTQKFPHAAFSPTPLKHFYDRKYRGFGNHRTVAVAIQFLGTENYNSAYGANYRQVIDMSNTEKSYYLIDSGVSESVFSQHYDDQQKLHEKFEYLEMKQGHQRLNEYELKLKLKLE